MKLKDSSIVKIAVQFEDRSAALIEFDQKQPLATIIQDLCSGWKLPQPDQYALQFSENARQNYITEKNRNEIKNGDVLSLAYSPSKTAQDILFTLNSGTDDEKMLALEKLAKLSTDLTFALEFISKQGFSLVVSIIEQKKCQNLMLAYCLQSFVELMDHGIVSWDTLESPFISTVASYVVNHSKNLEVRIVQASLAILESFVLNSTGKYGQVEKEITIPNLVTRLESPNPVVQQNAIALINALFQKVDLPKRKAISSTLWSKQVRQTLTKIIQTASDQVLTCDLVVQSINAPINDCRFFQMGAEMAHQLYVLQTLCFGLLEQRMNSKMDPQDQESLDKIKVSKFSILEYCFRFSSTHSSV